MIRPVTPEEAISLVRSGDRVFIHTAAAAPQVLIEALGARVGELSDVETVHLHIEGSAPFVAPGAERSFRARCLFIGPNMRTAIAEGRADYVPVFLSDIPALFRQAVLPLDVALIQVSPPDRHGFCSLGVSIDASRAAVECADRVIAAVNPNMPRTHGDGLVHVSRFSAVVETDVPLPEHAPPELNDVERSIGRHLATMIDDGSTLQMGIGAIPDAVLRSLGSHRRLGIHTEMFSDGIVGLVEAGVITGEEKRVHPGKVVGTFCVGTRKVYDFMDDNPQVVMLDVAYTNDTAVIRRNPKVVAINSAIEVDLTGQVCADSIGPRMYSGVGGQMDFVRGAALSPGGKPIIALPSQTSKGESRIVPFLKQGAGVVTTRAHVQYIATEYGVADLRGRSLVERARLLTAIAHPDHREALERATRERFKHL
jgi:acyl-CoA hydrolase